MEPVKTSSRRCAIYTRKSSEEGLEQDFNSLHAQREACEAFIKSQTGEGWRLVKTAYDDGGLSGGTMERPALQRLLGDNPLGRSRCPFSERPQALLTRRRAFHKVDRLTRSLAAQVSCDERPARRPSFAPALESPFAGWRSSILEIGIATLLMNRVAAVAAKQAPQDHVIRGNIAAALLGW